jgi:hypothetical protein
MKFILRIMFLFVFISIKPMNKQKKIICFCTNCHGKEDLTPLYNEIKSYPVRIIENKKYKLSQDELMQFQSGLKQINEFKFKVVVPQHLSFLKDYVIKNIIRTFDTRSNFFEALVQYNPHLSDEFFYGKILEDGQGETSHYTFCIKNAMEKIKEGFYRDVHNNVFSIAYFKNFEKLYKNFRHEKIQEMRDFLPEKQIPFLNSRKQNNELNDTILNGINLINGKNEKFNAKKYNK